MKNLPKRVKYRIADLLSLDKMSGRFHILSLNYIFAMVYYTVETVFVNTLLYRVTPDISIVILYRVIVYISCAVAMNAAAYLAHTYSPVAVLKIGSFLYVFMYAALFFGMDYMQVMMYPAAVLSGLGYGFYWSGHNVLLTHYTSRQNREVGVGILGIIQGVITLFVPMSSGIVIQFMPGNSGYRVMFGLAIASVLGQLYYQKKLVTVEQNRPESQFRLAFRLLRRKASCQLMLAFEFIRGFRDGTFLFFLNVLLFKIISDEALVGVNTFLTGMLSIIGSWAYGRLTTGRLRARNAFFATTLLLAFCVLLFWRLTVWSVMLFAGFNSFFQLFITYSCYNTSYDILGENAVTRQAMAELIGFREFAVDAGRVLGLFCVLLFPATDIGRIQAMCVLTATQYIAVFLLVLAQRVLDHKQVQHEAIL